MSTMAAGIKFIARVAPTLRLIALGLLFKIFEKYLYYLRIVAARFGGGIESVDIRFAIRNFPTVRTALYYICIAANGVTLTSVGTAL